MTTEMEIDPCHVREAAMRNPGLFRWDATTTLELREARENRMGAKGSANDTAVPRGKVTETDKNKN